MTASNPTQAIDRLLPPAGQVPIVRVQGTHAEIGFQLGSAQAPQIQAMIETYRHLFELAGAEIGLENWQEAILHAHKYLPFAEESTPECVEELRGLARGAGVSFDDVVVLNCMEAIASDALHLGCTSFALSPEWTSDGSVLIGHNEDWIPEDISAVYLVHARPEGEPAFLALTYGALLPNIGFNECGLAQCCDSVYPNDARIGVPRILVSRRVLAARSLAGAVQASLNPRRDAGYSHLIVHESGEIYNVEISARQFAMLYASDGLAVHTNNYLDRRMKAIEKNPDSLINSQIRYNRARRLLETQRGRADRLSIRTVLSDHVNYPHSICNHISSDDLLLDRQQTIVSLTIDLTARRMEVAWGTPCRAEFFGYELEA
jgi:isopenicillin-N N-acyltransferase-like protein